MEYEFDYIDGVEIPPMVITDDYTLQGEHKEQSMSKKEH